MTKDCAKHANDLLQYDFRPLIIKFVFIRAVVFHPYMFWELLMIKELFAWVT